MNQEDKNERQKEDELLEAIAEGKIDGCTAFRTLCVAAQKKEDNKEK